MENVKLWQWIVIAMPAFIAGCVLTYWICKDRIHALESLLMEEAPDRQLTRLNN